MKDKINYIQVPGYTEPEQLLNLLKAAGFTTTAQTTEKLLKTKNGTYSLPLFRINEKNEAIGLHLVESLQVAMELPKIHNIAKLLADRFMTDVDLVDKHPETGEHQRGLGYVSARINGVFLPYKQVGGRLIQSYIQGIITEKDVAAKAFWPVMVEMPETLSQVAEAEKELEAENQKIDNNQVHVSEVCIFRNPQNHSELEFRMRCKVDGVQQMGKSITGADCERIIKAFSDRQGIEALKNELAQKYFKNEIDCATSRRENQGLKR